MNYWFIIYALSATDYDIVEAITRRDQDTSYYVTEQECDMARVTNDRLHLRYPPLVPEFVVPYTVPYLPTVPHTFCIQDDVSDLAGDLVEEMQE